MKKPDLFRRLLKRVCNVLPFRILHSEFLGRVGHLAIEPDCFAKENTMGPRRRFIGILALAPEDAGNPVLLDYWRQARKYGLLVVTGPKWLRLLRPLASSGLFRFDLAPYSVAINETARYYSILHRWQEEGRKPLLRLTDEDRGEGSRTLRKMGLGEDSWFVCMHARTPGYSPEDEQYHSHRNAAIEDFIPAMRSITDAGGWVIRMGDTTMERLPELDRVVDYAHSDLKSPFMDVFLCAACRFFLGNTSGIILVADVFGTPTGWTNLTPMSSLPTSGNIGLPQLLRSRKEDRILGFAEVLGSSAGDFRLASLYEEAGIDVINNTPEEIRELALELLALTGGGEDGNPDAFYTDQDRELREQLHALFRPGHYAYGSTGRLGRDFLRRHRDLLEYDSTTSD